VVDDCSSTVTGCLETPVTVNVPEPTLVTVPTASRVPKFPPKGARLPDDPGATGVGTDPGATGTGRTIGAWRPVGPEFPKASATDNPTTARASAAATIQAVIALANSLAVRLRPLGAAAAEGGAHE
jgi:hypothetical protein